jgi:hypothetical protein
VPLAHFKRHACQLDREALRIHDVLFGQSTIAKHRDHRIDNRAEAPIGAVQLDALGCSIARRTPERWRSRRAAILVGSHAVSFIRSSVARIDVSIGCSIQPPSHVATRGCHRSNHCRQHSSISRGEYGSLGAPWSRLGACASLTSPPASRRCRRDDL